MRDVVMVLLLSADTGPGTDFRASRWPACTDGWGKGLALAPKELIQGH